MGWFVWAVWAHTMFSYWAVARGEVALSLQPMYLSVQMRFLFVFCITLLHPTVGIFSRCDCRAEVVVCCSKEPPEQWPDCVLGNFMNCSQADKVSEYLWKCGEFCPAAVRQDEARSRTVLGQIRAWLGQSPSFDISTEKGHCWFWASFASTFLKAK